ncbi:MAG: UDP-N-acetylglucosamine 2-epimerase (non-hydrolyzing) [Deltaproteobacteria bacterium]|nr:MAG: UDP-N-acetylglucosamine 2-epimerase (non-hydrolyzing) [Deltaproteobacteria bacterium]
MILVAFGTRPEIIKLFPVINELKAKALPFKTLFSGQQLDLYEDVKELVPSPDFSFADSFSGNGKHNSLGMSFIKICQAAERLFSDHHFDMTIVQGDTTTAWALAQMAFYNNIKVAHIEAGLRTFDVESPYPEELNRTLITQVACLNFAPTKQAYDNLVNSGAQSIYLVGNTIVDAVNYFKARLHLTAGQSNKVLVTIHRRENHAYMAKLFDELQEVASKNPELELIFPMHPNPNVTKHQSRLTADNIRVISPIGYPDMLRLINQARFIISDSGGIQEEATCFNKKVLIVRAKTERPEVIEMGLGLLADKDIQKVIDWAKTPPKSIKKSPYGDGDAAQKIVRIVSEFVDKKKKTGKNNEAGL